MPNIHSILGEYIRKLARKELRPLIGEAKKRSAEHRRAIAALKRDIAALQRELKATRSQLPAKPSPAVPKDGSKLRLRIDGMKNHRKRLGLSAKDFGTLLGVSSLTVYNWETGKSKPRRTHLPRIAHVRELGKREAASALKLMKAE